MHDFCFSSCVFFPFPAEELEDFENQWSSAESTWGGWGRQPRWLENQQQQQQQQQRMIEPQYRHHHDHHNYHHSEPQIEEVDPDAQEEMPRVSRRRGKERRHRR